MKPSHILIVDDDPLNIIVLERTLKDGFQITSANSAQQGLVLVQEHNFDLIILDIMMPEINGFEMIKMLRENPRTKDIPVIFISGNDSQTDEAKGLELGAMDYITKPFSPAIVLARVKNQLAIKHKSDLLERLVSIDGLTEIPNRRYFDENLSREWRRGMRNSTPLSVMLIDIDFFKQFNDNYGHRAGDECLKQVAQAIYANCQRATDFAARYGGEEFACVFSDCPSQEAVFHAKRIAKAVKSLGVEHGFSSVSEHVTVSIGIATAFDGDSDFDDEHSLLEQADISLYKAKAQGRNCIIFSKQRGGKDSQ